MTLVRMWSGPRKRRNNACVIRQMHALAIANVTLYLTKDKKKKPRNKKDQKWREKSDGEDS